MKTSVHEDVRTRVAGRRIASCLIGLLLVSTGVSFAVGYDDWLQTSKDAGHSGHMPGITMCPINEYPRPTGGMPPTYAWIADLDEPYRGGNIGTHIASWYEGEETEENLRVAFTTTNCDDVGAIYCVDADGGNIEGFPIVFEDGNYDSEGDAESSIAVYNDVGQKYDTRLVAALNGMDDGVGPENQVRCYDLSGDLVWWSDTDDWASRHCSPVIWTDPEWNDTYNEDEDDDDFVYFFEFDDDDEAYQPGKSRVIALDLTKDKGGGQLNATYTSEWFGDLTPTYSTPVICEVPNEDYSGSDTLMLFFLDMWEYSDNIGQYIKTGTRAIAIDINPANRNPKTYQTVFNISFEQYDTMVIPGLGGPETDEYIDLHLTVDMDPAAVHLIEDGAGEANDWWGFVFGVAEGSSGTGPDVIFVDKNGTVSAEHDLSHPVTRYGATQPTQTDPLVIGSPAVKDAANPNYMGEAYVLYHDRVTGSIGTAYFKDVTEIDANQVYLAPIFLPNDDYMPLSPVITDEFLYVGCCHAPYEAPYRDNGGMVHINLQTIRANTTIGLFHAMPFSLGEGYAQFRWHATPALIQTNETNQYLYMGVSDINLCGGKLWRLST